MSDVPWAAGPGETLPNAPPLHVCADPACGCSDTKVFDEAVGVMGWRCVWRDGKEVR